MSKKHPKGGHGNQQSEPKHSNSEKEFANRHVYVEPGVEIDLVQDLKDTYETSQRDNTTHNDKQLFWTKISAGLILLYAGLTFWQACTARNALTSSKDNFRSEQRPYVWASPIGGYVDHVRGTNFVMMPTDKGEVLIAANITLTNGGHSPAIEVAMTKIGYKIGPREQIEEEVREYKPQYADFSSEVIANGSSRVPTGDTFTKSSDVYQSLKNGTWEMYLVGGVRYRDIFSPKITPYETTYCFRVNMEGLPFGDCDFGEGSFGNSVK
jgi:hypothetical protein